MKKFPLFLQQQYNDCGPTCLRMVLKFYGRNISVEKLKKLCPTNKSGVTLLDLSDAAETIGFSTMGVRLAIEQLTEVELPCILHWAKNHFVVLYAIENGIFYIANPAIGLINHTEEELSKNWSVHEGFYKGITLILGPNFKAIS